MRELIARRRAALPLRAGQRGRQVRPRPRRRPGRRRARGGAAGLAIRDKSKVDAFARELAGDDRRGRRRGPRRGAAGRQARRAGAARGRRQPPGHRPTGAAPTAPAPPRRSSPTCATPGSRIERETLKLVIQHPDAVGRSAADVGGRRLHPPDLPRRLGARRGRRRPGRGRRRRRAGPRGCATPRRTRSSPPRSRALGVEPVLTAKDPSDALRRRARLPAPGAHRPCAGSPTSSPGSSAPTRSSRPTEYNKMFGELVALEQHRRDLRDQQVGRPVRLCAALAPPTSRSVAGSGCSPGAAAVDGGCVAGTRDAAVRRRRAGDPPACRGSRWRRRTGTATPTCCASSRSGRGASSASSTPLGLAEPRAAPGARPRAGHRERRRSSGTCRWPGGAACA